MPKFLNELKKKYNLSFLNLDIIFKPESQDYVAKGLYSFLITFLL